MRCTPARISAAAAPPVHDANARSPPPVQPYVEYTEYENGPNTFEDYDDLGSATSSSGGGGKRAANFRENMSSFLSTRTEQAAHKIKVEEKRADNESRRLLLEEKKLEMEAKKQEADAKRQEADSQRTQSIMELLARLVADKSKS